MLDLATLASAILPLVWREHGPRLAFAEPDTGVVYQILEFGGWTERPFQLTVMGGDHAKQVVTFHPDRPDAVKHADEDHVRRVLSAFPSSDPAPDEQPRADTGVTSPV